MNDEGICWAVRQDITVLPADDPQKMRLGWKCWWREGDHGGYWIYPKEIPEDLAAHIKECPSCAKAFQELKLKLM